MRFSFGKASLIFKIILANSLILVVAISFNVYWNSALHKGSIERLIQEKTTIILESVEGSVVRAMERQSHSDVQQALRHYGSFKGIWKIHIFRPDGTIMASSDEGEVNKKVENPDFYLKNRSFDREEVSRNRDGKRVREVISFHVYPIENQPKCFECHDRKTKVIDRLIRATAACCSFSLKVKRRFGVRELSDRARPSAEVKRARSTMESGGVMPVKTGFAGFIGSTISILIPKLWLMWSKMPLQI